MYILRAKTDDNITTFSFQILEAANEAASYVMRTSAAGFIAEVESESSTNGKILKKWDHKRHLYGDRYARKLSYTTQSGAYRDTVWAVLGHEEECRHMADETNAKADCWASTTCHVKHLVGPLWQCVFCDPYKD